MPPLCDKWHGQLGLTRRRDDIRHQAPGVTYKINCATCRGGGGARRTADTILFVLRHLCYTTDALDDVILQPCDNQLSHNS